MIVRSVLAVKDFFILNRIYLAFATALVGSFTSLIFLFKNRYPLVDTDIWYHQAISRITVQGGLIKSLPQAEDLNWGYQFPEKEFLFHILTSFGYYCSGDSGVEWSVHLVALLIIASIFCITKSILSPKRAFLLTALMTLCVPIFSMRMMLVRPHVLAVFFFIIILWGLLQNKHLRVFIGALGFVLSYHAFHIPIAILGIWGGVSFIEKSKLNYKVIVFGFLGVVVGVLLNPYFPSNFLFGIDLLKIALNTTSSLPGMEAGGELAAIPWNEFLYTFWPQILIMIWVIIFWWKRPDRNNEKGTKLIAFWLMSLLFLFITQRSQRGVEYWIPLVTITFAVALSYLSFFSKKQMVAFSFLFAMPIYYLQIQLRSDPDLTVAAGINSAREAVLMIPSDSTGYGKKVVNTNFGIGEILLYQREDLRFVDLLDPLLLRNANVDKFEKLRAFKLGLVADPYAMLKEIFKADFVISDFDSVSEQLSKDRRFKELGKSDSIVRVFQLLPQ